MNKYIVFLLLPFIASLFARAQDYSYQLTRHRSNKVILLGEWKAEDKAQWTKLLALEGLLQYDFSLLDRTAFINEELGVDVSGIEGFESWLYERSGTARTNNWITLDIDNQYVCSGRGIPSYDEFSTLLDNNGLRSPQSIIIDFLRDNPGHLDARSEYLREVRRRAIARLPSGLSEDLDEETDFLIFGILAAQIDATFLTGSWRGIELGFLRPEEESQPETYSPLMKAALARHIPKVESAILEFSTDDSLWDIWGWMARAIPDYKWEPFISSLNSFTFGNWPSCPSPKASAWLISDAMAKSNWRMVLQLSEAAKAFTGYPPERKVDWSPNSTGFHIIGRSIRDYPQKSAYTPLLEAQLRLGSLDDANNTYDEMLRIFGVSGMYSYTNNALLAASVAEKLGMDDIAELWQRGELINKTPHAPRYMALPGFVVYDTDQKKSIDLFREFHSRLRQVTPQLSVSGRSDDEAYERLGIGINDRDDSYIWALFGKDAQLLTSGTSLPDPDEIQSLLDRFHLNKLALAQKYYRDFPNDYGFILNYAFGIIDQQIKLINRDDQIISNDDNEDFFMWGETSRLLNIVINNAPHLLVHLPEGNMPQPKLNNSQILRNLSNRLLPHIERLIASKPSSTQLWRQWLFWRSVEGSGRSVVALMDKSIPSPLSTPGTVPPWFVLDECYNEYYREENWPKVVEMLLIPWDRTIQQIESATSGESDYPMINFGANVVLPMIEALLRDGKLRDADDVFSKWVELGGTFSDNAKVIEVALSLGNQRLAREWESKITR